MPNISSKDEKLPYKVDKHLQSDSVLTSSMDTNAFLEIFIYHYEHLSSTFVSLSI